MYDWIFKLKSYIEKELDTWFFNHPASDTELDRLEDYLQLKLPVSYREFLKICNGTDFSSPELFSTEEISNFHKEWGFKPWTGKLEFNYEEGQMKNYYSDKPLHFLVFARMDSLNYCFDTRELINGEYPICVFEPENKLKETLRVYSNSFDRFVLNEVKELSDWWEMPESWHEKNDFLEKIDTLSRMGNS